MQPRTKTFLNICLTSILGFALLSSCSTGKKKEYLPKESLKPKVDFPEVRTEALESPREFAFFYSNDIIGEIEACGCTTTPYGGLIRQATFMSRKAAELGSVTPFALDGGNLFFKNQSMPSAFEYSWKMKAETLANAFSILNYKAFVPGEFAFAAGTSELKKLQKLADFSFIAANLKDPNNAIEFKDYRILEENRLKVGLVGLVSSEFNYPKSFEIKDPKKTLEDVLGDHHEKADVWIVLSHMGYEQDVLLAESVNDLNLPVKPLAIVGGGSQAFLQEGGKINGIHLFQAKSENHFVGFAHFIETATGWKRKTHELVALGAQYVPDANDTDRSSVQKVKTLVSRAKELIKAHENKLFEEAESLDSFRDSP